LDFSLDPGRGVVQKKKWGTPETQGCRGDGISIPLPIPMEIPMGIPMEIPMGIPMGIPIPTADLLKQDLDKDLQLHRILTLLY